MKYFVVIVTGLMLTGCASVQETYHLDQEFGNASRHSWEQQFAYPEAGQAPVVPTGIEGITAEEIMGVYNGTFAEEPVDQNIISFGLPAGN